MKPLAVIAIILVTAFVTTLMLLSLENSDHTSGCAVQVVNGQLECQPAPPVTGNLQ